jgi:hypothetical protein
MCDIRALVALLAAGSLFPASGQTAILQLQILEGEGAVHAAGARSSRPLTIQVTDEAGRPVNGVAVNLRLPDEGASGVFGNGLKSAVLLTGADGLATERGIRWGMTPGPVRIRVTAAKEQARAGLVVSQYVSGYADPAKSAAARPASPEPSVPKIEKPPPPAPDSGIRIFETPPERRPAGSRRAWWLALIAGAAGGAAAVYLRQSGRGAAVQDAGTAAPAIRFGTPVVTIGRP